MKTLVSRLLVAGVMLWLPLTSVHAQKLGNPEPEITLTQGTKEQPAPASVPTIVYQGAASDSGSYLTADMLIWTRSMSSGPLFVDGNTGATIFDTSGVMQFNWNLGPRLTAGRALGDGLSAEASFFGIYDWRARGNTALDATNGNIAVLPFGGVPITFDQGDTQRYDYTSRMTNIEFNARQQVNSNLSLLVGFRYINLAEQLSAELYRADASFFGDWRVRTENNLFGGQVGGDWAIQVTDRFKIVTTGKFGVFGACENQTTSGSFFTPGPAGPPVIIPGPRGIPVILPGAPLPDTYGERRARAGQVAFLGEIGMKGSYQLSDSVAVHAGYNVIWLTGVATAPNQITSSSFNPGGAANISTGGNVVVHGAFTGIEIKW